MRHRCRNAAVNENEVRDALHAVKLAELRKLQARINTFLRFAARVNPEHEASFQRDALSLIEDCQAMRLAVRILDSSD